MKGRRCRCSTACFVGSLALLAVLVLGLRPRATQGPTRRSNPAFVNASSDSQWVDFQGLSAEPKAGPPDLKSGGRIWLFCITALSEETAMLPHLLKHYIDLGIKPAHMLIMFQAPSPRPGEGRDGLAALLKPVARQLQYHGLPGFYLWTGLLTQSFRFSLVRA